MFPNEFFEFNINDLTGLDDNFDFNWLNWDSAGPSQPYSGVDVQGDLGNYPNPLTPSTAPTSLYPTNGAFSNEGYNSPFYQGSAMPSVSPQQAITTLPSPVPTLGRGSPTLSPNTYAAPDPPTQDSYAQVIPNPDDLGFDLSTATGSPSLPAVHPTSTHDQSYEEFWHQCTQSDPSYFATPAFDPVTGATPPGTSLAAPIASSSGSQRTRQPTREGRRRYDPIKSAKKKADSKTDWDLTLVRFQVQLDTLYSVQNGQPSGGLVPETALADIERLVKEDLKRSPLRDTKAGEGKRARDVEDYLKGLLRALRPVEPASTPTGADSDEDGTTAAAFSRLADELETQLAAVNQHLALRQSAGPSKNGQRTGLQRMEQVKKNGKEKARRDSERHHLDRISHLFKAPQQQPQWSKKEVLILAVLFLLYGPDVFPRDFVEVRPNVPGL